MALRVASIEATVLRKMQARCCLAKLILAARRLHRAYVGGNPATAQKARKAVSEFLQALLKPGSGGVMEPAPQVRQR